MKNLYDFITSLCKDRNMKLEDLQKKLEVSRSTLYRYMKGINQITPNLEQGFIEALNMDKQEALTFSKYVSLSAFDQSLIESRYVLDDFLFGKQPKSKTVVDVDMVFYNNDKYLRTLKEVLDFIYSFGGKDALEGGIKIVNCLNENIFFQLTEFLEKAFSDELELEVEHFVGLSETDYLQNACSFINIFPLMRYESYKMYYKEKEIEDNLVNDSLLVSLKYEENGEPLNQYFSISFYENGMPECIAFTDAYMYSFLSKRYESLKHSYKNAIQKHDSIDFMDDILIELSRQEGNYIIKPNPCYDKIPYEAYVGLTERVGTESLMQFLSAMYGQELDPAAMPPVLEMTMKYVKRRIDYSRVNKQIDVYSKDGLIEFAKTGKLTDHMEHLPAFSQGEIRMILEYLRRRNDDPDDDYKLYITESELTRRDLVVFASKGFGIIIEYIYPERREELWKMLFIQSGRLASVFCDYIENHIPVNQAMPKEKADSFLKSLIDTL